MLVHGRYLMAGVMVALLFIYSIRIQQSPIMIQQPTSSQTHEDQYGWSPFMSSLGEFDTLDCEFYRSYNKTKMYKECAVGIRKLKTHINFTNPEQIKKFSSCAVVGSSSDLLQHSYGKEISSHEKIFRMNEAPTVGYEEFVGDRTDFRLMHIKRMDTVKEELPHEKYYRILSLTVGTVATFGMLQARWNESTDYLIKPNLLLDLAQTIHPFEMWQYEESMIGKVTDTPVATGYCSPSTGMRGIFVACMLCKKVSVFGFSMEFHPDQNWSYFRGTKGNCESCWTPAANSTSHCFLRERDVKLQWVEKSMELYGSQLTIFS